MLRWEAQSAGSSEAWYAYSGQVVVGMVVELARPLEDGRRFVWHLSKVQEVFGWKHRGHTKTAAGGKTALARAWKNWCEACELTSTNKEPTNERMAVKSLGRNEETTTG